MDKTASSQIPADVLTRLDRQLSNSKMNPWGATVATDIKNLISHIIPSGGEISENADVISEIIVTALKAVQSQIGRGDLKLLSRSLRELRYAFKIFKTYKGIRKVTIFGSARTKPNNPEYKLAKQFAALIRKQGYMIITGAGPGIMAAGNEGAGEDGSFGVNIKLPFEQFPNKFIAEQPTYIDCRYFFTRKLVFVKEANAGVFFPGGFGTLDEAFELLTLVQTGKCDPMPILLLDVPGGTFWKAFEKVIAAKLLKPGKISKEDLKLFKIITKPEAAVKEITNFYSNYHSIRFVGPHLVMRLNKFVTDAQLAHLNKNFKDIIKIGSFQRTAPLKEEENQPELAHLPRIIFDFNRINNGRLRQLIDYMNKG